MQFPEIATSSPEVGAHPIGARRSERTSADEVEKGKWGMAVPFDALVSTGRASDCFMLHGDVSRADREPEEGGLAAAPDTVSERRDSRPGARSDARRESGPRIRFDALGERADALLLLFPQRRSVDASLKDGRAEDERVDLARKLFTRAFRSATSSGPSS